MRLKKASGRIDPSSDHLQSIHIAEPMYLLLSVEVRPDFYDQVVVRVALVGVELVQVVSLVLQPLTDPVSIEHAVR